LTVVQRFPALTLVPAYLIGVGLRPEHAPDFARRAPEVDASGEDRHTVSVST
jgi:hypothetical protein